MKYYDDFSPPHDWLHQAHPWFMCGPVYEDDQYIGNYIKIRLFGRIFYKQRGQPWIVTCVILPAAKPFPPREYLGWTLDQWALAAAIYPDYQPTVAGAAELRKYELPEGKPWAYRYEWANRLWWELEHP